MHISIIEMNGFAKEQYKTLESFLHTIIHNQKQILMNQTEATALVVAATAQIQKVGEESKATLKKVSDLEAVIAAQDNVSPELQAAFDALKAQVQTVDDLIPDAPVVDPGAATEQPA